MRIAFVSYEYPPDTGYGGIATYVFQAAKAFSSKGIDVHVICATHKQRKTTKEAHCLTIHKLLSPNQESFNQQATKTLTAIHCHSPIDLIEVPDYGGGAYHIKAGLPEPVLIVRLHTPSYLVKQLNDYYYDKQWHRKLKSFFKPYDYRKDAEYRAALKADYIVSPTLSLKNIIARDWKIDKSDLLCAPHIYQPSKDLLSIPIKNNDKTVLYFGRLETRKGVYNLAKAIPEILREVPDAKFLFIGADCKDFLRRTSMKKALLRLLKAYEESVTFLPSVPLESIPQYLETATVCVFPSLWENFPNVCLEAMAAGKGIVASRNGGMKDLLEDINGGVLIDPHQIDAITEGIVQLLNDNKLRSVMAKRSREKVVNFYGDVLIDDLIGFYDALCKRTKQACLNYA